MDRLAAERDYFAAIARNAERTLGGRASVLGRSGSGAARGEVQGFGAQSEWDRWEETRWAPPRESALRTNFAAEGGGFAAVSRWASLNVPMRWSTEDKLRPATGTGAH